MDPSESIAFRVESLLRGERELVSRKNGFFSRRSQMMDGDRCVSWPRRRREQRFAHTPRERSPTSYHLPSFPSPLLLPRILSSLYSPFLFSFNHTRGTVVRAPSDDYFVAMLRLFFWSSSKSSKKKGNGEKVPNESLKEKTLYLVATTLIPKLSASPVPSTSTKEQATPGSGSESTPSPPPTSEMESSDHIKNLDDADDAVTAQHKRLPEFWKDDTDVTGLLKFAREDLPSTARIFFTVEENAMEYIKSFTKLDQLQAIPRLYNGFTKRLVDAFFKDEPMGEYFGDVLAYCVDVEQTRNNVKRLTSYAIGSAIETHLLSREINQLESARKLRDTIRKSEEEICTCFTNFAQGLNDDFVKLQDKRRQALRRAEFIEQRLEEFKEESPEDEEGLAKLEGKLEKAKASADKELKKLDADEKDLQEFRKTCWGLAGMAGSFANIVPLVAEANEWLDSDDKWKKMLRNVPIQSSNFWKKSRDKLKQVVAIFEATVKSKLGYESMSNTKWKEICEHLFVLGKLKKELNGLFHAGDLDDLDEIKALFARPQQLQEKTKTSSKEPEEEKAPDATAQEAEAATATDSAVNFLLQDLHQKDDN